MQRAAGEEASDAGARLLEPGGKRGESVQRGVEREEKCNEQRSAGCRGVSRRSPRWADGGSGSGSGRHQVRTTTRPAAFRLAILSECDLRIYTNSRGLRYHRQRRLQEGRCIANSAGWHRRRPPLSQRRRLGRRALSLPVNIPFEAAPAHGPSASGSAAASNVLRAAPRSLARELWLPLFRKRGQAFQPVLGGDDLHGVVRGLSGGCQQRESGLPGPVAGF